jgi:hypothetical protein
MCFFFLPSKRKVLNKWQLQLMRTQKWTKLYNMVSFRLHFCFLVLFVVFLIPGHCLGHLCLPKKHVALFIFGDSLFDAGNNDYINTTTDTQANFGPYGETFFKYPSGRFSNGRLIPDFIGKMSIYVLLSLGFELFLNWLLKLHYSWVRKLAIHYTISISGLSSIHRRDKLCISGSRCSCWN